MGLFSALILSAFLLLLLFPVSVSVRIFGGFAVRAKILFFPITVYPRKAGEKQRQKSSKVSGASVKTYFYPALCALKCLTAGCKVTLRSANEHSLLSDSPDGEALTGAGKHTALLLILAFLSPFADEVSTEEEEIPEDRQTSICFSASIARVLLSGIVFFARLAREKLQSLPERLPARSKARKEKGGISAYAAK